MSRDMVEGVDLARVLLTYNLLVGALLIVAGEKLGVMAAGLLHVKRECSAAHASVLRDGGGVSRRPQLSRAGVDLHQALVVVW